MIINFGGGTSGGSSGGGDKNYIFIQSTPSAEWHIQHNLNKVPAVSIADSTGAIVVGDCVVVDNNNIVLYFNGAFSGKAYCN